MLEALWRLQLKKMKNQKVHNILHSIIIITLHQNVFRLLELEEIM